jgi:hypothetical protein
MPPSHGPFAIIYRCFNLLRIEKLYYHSFEMNIMNDTVEQKNLFHFSYSLQWFTEGLGVHFLAIFLSKYLFSMKGHGVSPIAVAQTPLVFKQSSDSGAGQQRTLVFTCQISCSSFGFPTLLWSIEYPSRHR